MTSVLSRFSDAFSDLLDVIRDGCPARCIVLGRWNQLNPNLVAITTRVADRRESLADELLVGERAIDFGGVEEGHASLDRRPDERDHLLLVRGRAVGKAQAHAAEPDGRNFEAALSKFALLHCVVLNLLLRSLRRRGSRGVTCTVAARARAPIIGFR